MLDDVDLSDVDLSNVDLSDVDLGDVDLDGGGSQAGSALGSGIDELKGGLQMAASEISLAVGADDTAESFREDAKTSFEQAAKFAPTIASYRDVDSVGDFGSYAMENFLKAAPNIVPYLVPYAGMALGTVTSGASTYGSIIHDQGDDINRGRAAIAAGIDMATNIPAARAFNSAKKALRSPLEEATKVSIKNGVRTTSKAMEPRAGLAKSVGKEFAKGAALDTVGSVASQQAYEYGVTGEATGKGADEAAVMGLLFSTVTRGGTAVVDKAAQNALVDVAASEAVKSGDVQKADGLVQSGINFLVGSALRKNRRFKDTAAGQDFNARVDKMQEQKEVMGNTNYQDFQETISGLSKKQQQEFFSQYAKGDRTDPRASRLATILDGIQTRATNALGTGRIENWLPISFNRKNYTPEVRKSIAKDYQDYYLRQSAEVREGMVAPKRAEKLINKYAGALRKSEQGTDVKMARGTINEDGDVVAPTNINTRSTTKYGSLDSSRQLGFIPQEILFKHSDTQLIKEQIDAYIFDSAHRITYAEQFGKNNENLNGLIYQMNKEMKEKAVVEGKDDYDYRMTRGEFDTYYDAMEAYNGVYNQFEHELGRKASSYLRGLTSMIALPLSAVSSLTEPFNLMIKVGGEQAVPAYFKAMGSMIQDLMSYITKGEVPKSEQGKQLARVGRAFSHASANLTARMEGDTLSKKFKTAQSLYYHVTGQTLINSFVNYASAHAAVSQAKDDINAMNSNPNTQYYKNAKGRLESLGINVTEAITMSRNPSLFNAAKTRIVSNFNKDVALNPTALDKPVWMSSGWGQMFAQLRSYPTMYTNTILPMLANIIDPRGKNGSQRAVDTARFLSTVGMLASVSFMQEYWKDSLKGGNSSDEELFAKGVSNVLAPMHFVQMKEVLAGNPSQLFTPASISIMNRETTMLLRAAQEGSIEIEELPFFRSFKGLF